MHSTLKFAGLFFRTYLRHSRLAKIEKKACTKLTVKPTSNRIHNVRPLVYNFNLHLSHTTIKLLANFPERNIPQQQTIEICRSNCNKVLL